MFRISFRRNKRTGAGHFIIVKKKYIRKRKRRTASLKSIALYQKHKEETRRLVHERLPYFMERYQTVHRIQFKPQGKISIKNTMTRWGSCSSKGNLNFSFRLALLPKHLSDYIIIHELCHLAEFNHSSKFWDLVALEAPLYNQYRHELKSESLR